METFNAIMKALIFIVMTGAAAIAMFVAACYFILGRNTQKRSNSTSPTLTATLSLLSADGSAPLVEKVGPKTTSRLYSWKPCRATTTTLFRPSWDTRNEFLRRLVRHPHERR